MRPSHHFVRVLAACAMVGLLCDGSSVVAQFQADKLCWDAVVLQMEGKHAQARDILKPLSKSLPKNSPYLKYYQELESLAARDVFDQHALRAPKEAEKSVESLAKYLVEPAKTDRDKAWIIYRWVTDRIAYDDSASKAVKRPSQEAIDILQSRKAVCDGYTNLYYTLAKGAGLEVTEMQGYYKSAHKRGDKLEKSTHAWNAVNLDGNWVMVDTSFGAGLDTSKGWAKRFDGSWFGVAPEQLILTHFPMDLLKETSIPERQYLPKPVTLEEFEKWPSVPLQLPRLGVSIADIRAKLEDKKVEQLLEVQWNRGFPKLTILNAPLNRTLKAGTKFEFRVETLGCFEMAVNVNGKSFPLTRRGPVFETVMVPPKGTLTISGKIPGQGTAYFGVVRYDVE